MKGVLKSKWFWGGLAIKVALLFFAGSPFLRNLFIPFLDRAVLNPLSNPWSNAQPSEFPYGGILYLILFVPRYLGHLVFGSLALGDGPLGLFLVKAPLLALDLWLFVSLSKLASERIHKIVFFYWLNPILIYITYVHGQLDVAAMAFAVASLVEIVRGREARSALLMGAATLCKFHVVILVPLLLVYVWNCHFVRPALAKIGTWIACWLTVTGLGFLPHLFANRFFYVSTTSPEALRVFSASLEFKPDQVLYLGVMAILLTVGRLCLSTRITERGLLLGSGLCVGVLLLVTNPMPGWYYWVMPFFALFFSWHVNAPRLLYGALIVFYFIHFTLLPRLIGQLPAYASGMSLTMLQTTLAGILVALWVLALKFEALLQRRVRPTLVAIAGDSGSGKNHISTVFRHVFNASQSLVVEGDDYHKWERGNEAWDRYTHLNPHANHLLSMAQHTTLISQGIPVLKSHYDHSTGRFTDPRELKPTKTLIVQGLHTLYLRGMRRSFDIKVFLDPHPLVRLAWKLQRDVKERGHSVEKVLQSLAKRAQDAELHINPQRPYADWIIEFVPWEPVTQEQVIAGTDMDLAVRHLVWNDAPIGDLVESLGRHPGFHVSAQPVEGNIDRVAIHVKGSISAQEVGQLADKIFPHLRQLTRGRSAPCWMPDHDGVSQLILLALLNGSQNQIVN